MIHSHTCVGACVCLLQLFPRLAQPRDRLQRLAAVSGASSAGSLFFSSLQRQWSQTVCVQPITLHKQQPCLLKPW